MQTSSGCQSQNQSRRRNQFRPIRMDTMPLTTVSSKVPILVERGVIETPSDTHQHQHHRDFSQHNHIPYGLTSSYPFG